MPIPTPSSVRLNRWPLLGAGFVIALALASVYTWADEGAAPESSTQADTTAEDPSAKQAENVSEDESKPAEEGAAEEPEDELVSVSFNGANLKEIAGFFMDQLGKPVLIDPSVKDKEISIMSRDQLPPAEAFELIGTALRGQGVIMVENARHLEFLPVEQIGKVNRRLVPADQSTADVVNQAEIVDKVFQLEHYDPAKLKDVIVPMLPEYAIVMSDPNTRRLIVTDAAANLQRIEQMVKRLDVPQANQTVEKIIPVKHGDASEIVSMLRIIIAGSLGEDAKAVFSNDNKRGGNRGGGNNNGGGGGPSVILMGSAEAPILLRADLARNRILAVAPPNVMEQIERWVKELDVKKDEQKPYMLIDIEHADIAEVSQQIMEVVQALSVDDAGNSVRVIPFTKSRQLLVYGSQGGRDLVMSLLKQLDVESSRYQVIEEIVLKHDSAENVKSKIEDLFSNKDDQSSRRRWWGNSRSNSDDGKKVKVTADTQRNTVTILTDPNRMERIRELIAEQWDLPIDLDAVKPKVYELEYIDPVQLKTVLEDMFTKSTTKTSGYWYDEVTTESANPVGRLFGQFSFQALRGTNKLIVSSKSSENYAVIDDLIKDLDQPQAAGLPVVIELKHANAEDLAEQLNAMFSEPGTPAAITRTPRGLSAALRQAGSNRNNNSNNQNNNQNNNRGGNTNRGGGDDDPNALSFWWSQARPNPEEQPTSNLIGKPRFIPISRRNAIAFLAPMAYGDPLREMIRDLDQPGMQVMIRAIITEVEHNDETTLGIRIASDPGILSDARLGDQAVGGSVSSAFADTFGSGRGTLNAGLNLNVLMQLLIRKFDLKILNEPRVYTADNQEAHFFDGQDVPVIVSDQSSRQDAQTFNRSFDYQSVGTRLHVRPHITQEGGIDLEVNLELSRIESGDTVFGNFIFNRREYQASVTLKDGQTVVLSGIVRQEDFKDVRKLPILGDIPLLGGLFRSTDKGVRNREVIVFITPQIVKATGDEAQQLSDRNKAWLEQIRGTMDTDEKKNGDNPLKPGVLDAQPSDPADRATDGIEALPAEIDDRLHEGAVETF